MKCTKEHRLSFTEKAKKIVDSLTLEEKVSLMSGSCTLQDMITEMQETKLPLMSKEEAAHCLLDAALHLHRQKS